MKSRSRTCPATRLVYSTIAVVFWVQLIVVIVCLSGYWLRGSQAEARNLSGDILPTFGVLDPDLIFLPLSPLTELEASFDDVVEDDREVTVTSLPGEMPLTLAIPVREDWQVELAVPQEELAAMPTLADLEKCYYHCVIETIRREMHLPTHLEISFHTFMSFLKITDKTSEQYKFVRRGYELGFIYVDLDGLLRYVDNRGKDPYVVAIPRGYGGRVGEVFEMTFTKKVDGKTVAEEHRFVIGELKGLLSTVEASGHRYRSASKNRANVLEFLIDEKVFYKTHPKVRRAGTMSELDKFEGKVIAGEFVGITFWLEQRIMTAKK